MTVHTASGLLACLVRRAGFLGWTRFWRTIYVLPGHERNEREGRLLFSIRYLYWLARLGYWAQYVWLALRNPANNLQRYRLFRFDADPVRARMVATELDALAKSTGRPRVMMQAAREYARQMVDRLLVRNVKPGQYAAAEARAGKAATQAMKAGDLEQAAADFLRAELDLSLSHAAIDRVARGINFVGYRTWTSRRFVRKHSLYTYRRALRARRVESIVSCLGHARRTASLRHMLTLARTDHDLYRQLPQSYRRLDHLHARHP